MSWIISKYRWKRNNCNRGSKIVILLGEDLKEPKWGSKNYTSSEYFNPHTNILQWETIIALKSKLTNKLMP